MNIKSTLSLAAIFLVLGIVYFATSYRPPEVTKGAALLFEGQNPDIDRIEMDIPGGINIILSRKDGLWNMEKPFEFKADDRYVNNLVTEIQDVYIDGVISNRVERQKEFVVDDTTGVKLRVYSAGKLLYDGVIGRQSSEIGHFYARKAGSKDIEIWRGMLSQEVRRSPNEWRDRTIYRFNVDDIVSISMVEGKITRTLKFENAVWAYSDGGTAKPVDNTKVRNIVGLISNLSGEDFADESDIEEVVKRNFDTTVTFTVRNGDSLTYHVWKPTETYPRWLFRKEGGDMLYRFYDDYGSLLPIEYKDIQPDQS